MKTIYLHIGTHKTGTSSIQTALHRSSGSFLYPRSGRLTDGSRLVESHYPLAWSVVKRYADRKGVPVTDAPWLRLQQELNSSDQSVAVLSSEFFWPAEPDEIRRIREYLQDFDVKVIIYFRNYWDLMVSSYKQRVKTGQCSRSFQEMMVQNLWTIDYGQICERWGAEFELDVRVYDSISDSLVDDFGSAIARDLKQADVTRNVSPSDAVIRILLIINRLEKRLGAKGETICHRVRRNLLTRRTPGNWVSDVITALDQRSIGDDSDRAFLRNAVSDLDGDFMQRYVSKHDQHHFQF